MIDDFNRKALSMEIDLSLPTERVMRALDQVIEWCGKPQAIRNDNGPEYISAKMTLWAEKQGIRLEYIQPGNPQQNAYVERYNRTVRYGWLGHYLFESIAEVQDYGTNWIWTYNHERPNMALGGLPPNRGWPSRLDLYFWQVLKMGGLPGHRAAKRKWLVASTARLIVPAKRMYTSSLISWKFMCDLRVLADETRKSSQPEV